MPPEDTGHSAGPWHPSGKWRGMEEEMDGGGREGKKQGKEIKSREEEYVDRKRSKADGQKKRSELAMRGDKSSKGKWYGLGIGRSIKLPSEAGV